VANQTKPATKGASDAGHGDGHGSHGVGRYFVIWGILLAFTGITVTTGRMDLGAANIFVAMAIATTKATLVLLFFMHLYEEGAVNRLILITSVVFALVLILGTFGDLLTRAHGALPNGGPLPAHMHGVHTTHGEGHAGEGAAGEGHGGEH
jgi:cytochrome c oxidase subunit 4